MINIGDIIDNRYNVLSYLGTGGMAVVFECKDLFSNKIVALKIMKEELLNDKQSVDLFSKEVKASVSMAHPNIVEIYQEGVWQNRPYLVMEYLQTQTLLDKIEYYTKFSVNEACQIMLQLLDALSYTHEHKIIHRDVKPQNIFYLSNGTIKLTDFGIAQHEKDAGIDGKIIGSVHYLAPEVLLGKPFSVASDIYAAGITFFELIIGRVPFDGTTQEVANSQINNEMLVPSKLNSQIPSLIDNIIFKATMKNPNARYKTAKEFKQSIENFLNGKKEKQSILRRIFG